MSKIQAKQFALLERRVQAARLWRLGYSLDAIAARLGIAHGTAWNDIHDTRCRLLLQEGITKADRQSAGWFEQEVIKHEAFREWERSKQDLVEIVKVPDPNEPDRLIIKSVKTVGRLGDPRYLATAQAAERRQAEIYGTDVDPRRVDPFGDESEDQDGGRTYRAVVEGRLEANAVRGSRLVKVDSKPVENEEELGAERPGS